MSRCIYCGEEGERHHIIFRRNGGLDMPLNRIYLCEEHHRGKLGPHKNKREDIRLKLYLQEEFINLFKKEYYSMEEIAKLLCLNGGQTKKIAKEVISSNFKYSRFDLIKYLMGGRFYSEYMLDEDYDDSWNCYEDDYYKLVL